MVECGPRVKEAGWWIRVASALESVTSGAASVTEETAENAEDSQRLRRGAHERGRSCSDDAPSWATALSGRPGCRRIDDLDPQLIQHLDIVLDAGPLKGGPGSTVVDVTHDLPRILREGEISGEEILDLIKR